MKKYIYSNNVNNGMKLITLMMLSLFLVLSFVSAEQQSLGIIKQNSCVRLIQTCSNCTTINISSVIYPDKTVAQSSINMITSDNFEWHYNFCNTSTLGQYIVSGHGNVDGISTPFGYDFFVTPTGEVINGLTTSAYIFFLLVLVVLMILSIKLMVSNSMSEDITSNAQLYEKKKSNEFLYYVTLLKQKLWILGVFGTYLSLLMFIGILNQLCYSLGLPDLTNILSTSFTIMGWGLVPFVIFWIAYILITFYLKTAEIMRYQFGGFIRER